NRDRHRRPDQCAVRTLAVAQRRCDLSLAPLTDAGLRIGRYVGTDDLSEPGVLEFEPAAELPAGDRLFGGVTWGVAIAAGGDRRHEIAAALDRRLGHSPGRNYRKQCHGEREAVQKAHISPPFKGGCFIGVSCRSSAAHGTPAGPILDAAAGSRPK